MNILAMEISEHFFASERHKTFYLACGPFDGPLVILLHGWPDLSIGWRHQLQYLGRAGYRAIAPDMRGYGNSTVHRHHENYAQSEIVRDMVEMFESFGHEKAVWVGHDWGSPVAWNLALRHPDLVKAVVSLCVPFGFIDSLSDMEKSINRLTYPVEEFPLGQWDYVFYYQTNFEDATREMEEDAHRFLKLMFRKGNPGGKGKPFFFSKITRNGGWFKKIGGVPDIPLDTDIISEHELEIYVRHLTENGFFGPNSWYLNGDLNKAYKKGAAALKLSMPVLFVHASFDYVCDTTTTRAAEPMRKLCTNLTEKRIHSGHWVAQEKPEELNGILTEWLHQAVDY